MTKNANTKPLLPKPPPTRKICEDVCPRDYRKPGNPSVCESIHLWLFLAMLSCFAIAPFVVLWLGVTGRLQ